MALAKAAVGLRRDGRLRRVDRLDGDVRFIQERVHGFEQRVVPSRPVSATSSTTVADSQGVR